MGLSQSQIHTIDNIASVTHKEFDCQYAIQGPAIKKNCRFVILRESNIAWLRKEMKVKKVAFFS